MAIQSKESPTLQKQYAEQFKTALKQELGLQSIMQVPEVKKIVVNVGAGEAVSNPKIIDGIVETLGRITGQAPVKTRARKSIAGFKLREESIIGVKVTLRGRIMYEFLDRLINAALPRVRDFNGLSRKAFDKQGNYTLGIKEQIIFPEINFDQIEKIHGLDITLVIKNGSEEGSLALLQKFKFPFRKN